MADFLPFYQSCLSNQFLTCEDGGELISFTTWAWVRDLHRRRIYYYTYLGVKFTCNGHWDAHLKDLVTSGKCKLNSLRILCNPT